MGGGSTQGLTQWTQSAILRLVVQLVPLPLSGLRVVPRGDRRSQDTCVLLLTVYLLGLKGVIMSSVLNGSMVEVSSGGFVGEETVPVGKGARVEALLDLVEGATPKHAKSAKHEIAHSFAEMQGDLSSALSDVDFLTTSLEEAQAKLKAAEALAAKPAKVPAASKVASKLLLQAVALRKASRVEGADMAALQEDATLRSGAWCAKEGTTLAQAHSAASAAASEAKAHVEANNMWGEWL